MNDQYDVFRGLGIEIALPHPDNFLKVRETLTRIGIASPHKKRLFQSCHILHKRGRYAILHFKELFALDGKPTNLSEEDIERRNTITQLLSDWELVDPIDPETLASLPKAPIHQVKIIPYREKAEWELIAKYSIGAPRE